MKTGEENTNNVNVDVMHLNNISIDFNYNFTIQPQDVLTIKNKVKILICDFTIDPPENFDLAIEKIENERNDSFQIDFLIMDKTKTLSDDWGLIVLNHFLEKKEFCIILKPDEINLIKNGENFIPTLISRPEFLNNSLFIHSICYPRIHFFDFILNPTEKLKNKFITAIHFGIDENTLASYEDLETSSQFSGRQCIKQNYSRIHWFAARAPAGTDPTTQIFNDVENKTSPDWKNVLKIPGNFEPNNFILAGVGFNLNQFSNVSEHFANLNDLVSEYEAYLKPPSVSSDQD